MLSFEDKVAELVLELCRLTGKFGTGSRTFFGCCRVLLNDLVDLLQPGIDLSNTLSLLLTGDGNFGDQIGSFADGIDDLA